MSATLDTVRAFSETLAMELAQAVREQDAETVAAFMDIVSRCDEARSTFIAGLNDVENTYKEAIVKAAAERTRAMKDLGAKLDKALENVSAIADEVRTRYEDAPLVAKTPAPLKVVSEA